MPGAQLGPGLRGDTLEQPGHLLGSGSPDGTTARAVNKAGSRTSARTFCGRAGRGRWSAPPGCRGCCSAEAQGPPPRLAVRLTASADSSHVLP